jgi:hypothetical protein
VRRALDSAVLDDAVATQDTVIQLITAIRRVAREVAARPRSPPPCAPPTTTPTRANRPSPGTTSRPRAQLIDALVIDAIRLLAALPERQYAPKAADALGLIALMAGRTWSWPAARTGAGASPGAPPRTG